MGNSSSSIELTAYEDACRADLEVGMFDYGLKLRTEKVLSAVVKGVSEGAMSLESLKSISTGLIEMEEEVLKAILEFKKDVWSSSDLFHLVEEFFHNSLATLDFCTVVDTAIKATRDNLLIVQMALNLLPPAGRPDEADCERIVKELRHFQDAPNPFAQDFVATFHTVRERHLHMLEKLVEKKRKLDRKLKGVKVWRKVSTMMLGTIVAVLLICSVVAAAMAAPPLATAVAAASSMPLESMGRWVKSLWAGYERELQARRELVQGMRMGTYVGMKDLDTIKALVANLENEMRSVMFSVEFATERRDPLAIHVCVTDIARKREAFVAELEVFERHIHHCRAGVLQARAIVQERILRRPQERSPAS